MSANVSETRTAAMAADFVEALANNVQLYADVAQRTRGYRLYAFCRRIQQERRAFHSALVWLVTGREGVELRQSWTHRIRRLLARFRIGRAGGARFLITQLQQSDAVLRNTAEQLLADPELDGAIWMVLGKLVSAVRSTDAELASLTNRRDARSPISPYFSPVA